MNAEWSFSSDVVTFTCVQLLDMVAPFAGVGGVSNEIDGAVVSTSVRSKNQVSDADEKVPSLTFPFQ